MPDQDRGGPASNRDSEQSPVEQLRSLLLRNPRQPLRLTEDHLVSLILLRRARAVVFGDNLFSDPAWDILLELYAAQLGARVMSLSDLAKATDTPLSTTERWIAALAERGLVKSTTDPKDSADVKIQLTPDAALKMEHLGDHWGSAFVSI